MFIYHILVQINKIVGYILKCMYATNKIKCMHTCIFWPSEDTLNTLIFICEKNPPVSVTELGL